MFTKFNISKPKKYTDKQTGQEKTFWQQIGTMTEFKKDDGSVSRIIEIPAIGLEANIFSIEPRPQQGQQQQAPPQAPQTPPVQPAPPAVEEEINVQNIPF